MPRYYYDKHGNYRGGSMSGKEWLFWDGSLIGAVIQMVFMVVLLPFALTYYMATSKMKPENKALAIGGMWLLIIVCIVIGGTGSSSSPSPSAPSLGGQAPTSQAPSASTTRTFAQLAKDPNLVDEVGARCAAVIRGWDKVAHDPMRLPNAQQDSLNRMSRVRLSIEYRLCRHRRGTSAPGARGPGPAVTTPCPGAVDAPGVRETSSVPGRPLAVATSPE